MRKEDIDDFEFQVESRLTSHGVYVTDFADEGDTYRLTYESISADEAAVIPHREIGRVINVFRDLHADDWSGVDIEATVTDLEDTELGEWSVDSEWIDDLENDDLSETDFSQRVLETITVRS
ncbi:hypothetical protein GOC83_05045 [Haloarcula rubripromontorii]|uniref:DUF8159 domain-containing protein n=1 Tax=Haloarcula rubripromontorii TaxID=1705562 RepID=A0A847TI03_9EURY|nr:hypothetical protein [Haloarcula rubripromontorii]NLV05502.1 hypothetical protein [Haloarcula rubripromontorii]